MQGFIYLSCTPVLNSRYKSKKTSTSMTVKQEIATKIKLKLCLVCYIWYLAGIYTANRLNLDALWQTDGTGIKIFRFTMSLQRFRFLLCCLRFDNIINTRQERKVFDKLVPIRDFFEKFVQNCRQSYVPSEYCNTDEMLPSFRGRCPSR